MMSPLTCSPDFLWYKRWQVLGLDFKKLKRRSTRWHQAAVVWSLLCCFNGLAAANDYLPPMQDAVNQKEPILPLPTQVEVNPDKVALGLRLFEDKGLSRGAAISCRTCHLLDRGGTDNEPLSPSIDGGFRSTNTPTIFNVGLYPLYGWFGLPDSLADVSEAIIKSKKGLDSDWPKIIPYLKSDAEYSTAFTNIYKDGIAPENVKDALAEYMRSLITPGSRFDRYLMGEVEALSAGEKRGYALFKEYGCVSCHQGVNIGANMVSPFNLFRDFLTNRTREGTTHLGRFNVTHAEEDKEVFRVPSLRNVALTAPYFHDGSAQTLEVAVDVMGRYMLGRVIPAADRRLLVGFLHTLTGELDGEPL